MSKGLYFLLGTGWGGITWMSIPVEMNTEFEFKDLSWEMEDGFFQVSKLQISTWFAIHSSFN